MTFSESINTCFSKYFVFQGRASRSEYWYWVLFCTLLGFCAGFIDGVFGLFSQSKGMGPITALIYLITLIPSLAVGVRRLHDTNHSGWWFASPWLVCIGFAVIIPTIKDQNGFGQFILVVLACVMLGFFVWIFFLTVKKGDFFENNYGPITSDIVNSKKNNFSVNHDNKHAYSVDRTHWVLSGFDTSGNVIRLVFDGGDVKSGGALVIGRHSSDADLVIADSAVSRKHAEIIIQGSNVFIRDLDSANGTRLNGQRISNSEQVPLPKIGTLSIGPIDLAIFGS